MNDWPNLVQPFDGILFRYKNIIQLKNIDTHYHMDEPWRPYAQWKEPDTKGHIMHDSIYVKYPE